MYRERYTTYTYCSYCNSLDTLSLPTKMILAEIC